MGNRTTVKSSAISFTKEMISNKITLVDKEISKIKSNHVSGQEWQNLNKCLLRRQQLQRLLDTM